MDKKNVWILTTFVAILLIISLQAVSFAEAKNHVGYLADVLCGQKGVSAFGSNLITNPEKHTVACMKMPPCEASGYGIYMKDAKSGKYVFYKFDEKGTELAKGLLKNTKKANNMLIKVEGTLDEDTIIVENIIEA
jgi:hypothetical protein